MTLGTESANENQPPTPEVRRRRCYNCQEVGHLRHQCSRSSREARVPMGVLSENPRVRTNDGPKCTYRNLELGQPMTSVPLRPDSDIDRHPPTIRNYDARVQTLNGGPNEGDLLQRAVEVLATEVPQPVGTDEFWGNPMSA
ncbi:unnamed protein product [Gordionus sp. m RMFG-2023]